MTPSILRPALMALALLFAGAADSNPPLPTPPERKQQEQAKAGEREQESSKDQRGTQNNPLVIEMLPSKDAEAIAEQKRDYEDDKSFYDGLIAWATIGLAVVTSILALFTAKLWNATKTLAEEAKRTADRQAGEMRDSLATAKQSADAAKSMAAIMDDTAERQLRAYVAATPTKLNGPSSNMSQFFSMINHGQTPAYNVVETGLMDIFPHPLPPNFNFPALPHPHASRTILHPHATNYSGLAGAARVFTDQEIAYIFTGQYRLYVYGLITYTDVFKKSHTTKFCHSILASMELSQFFRGTLAPGTPVITESANQHDETD